MTARGDYRRVPVSLLEAAAQILHWLALEQARDGQLSNSSTTLTVAHRLDQAVNGNEHQ